MNGLDWALLGTLKAIDMLNQILVLDHQSDKAGGREEKASHQQEIKATKTNISSRISIMYRWQYFFFVHPS
jgi:hypothetical protein